ncbi:MAG: helix-turn-helix domain-containing protein, partial [Acetatifactor sp.]|nr:helix-turn-helix domain-containing protein [Acetatifactor sp.]
IKAFRKERKMTQEQLAEAMGVTVGAVYKWESKQSNPDLHLMIELADLFEVSTDVLLGYEWRNGSMGAALDRIIAYRRRAQYDDGVIESEKALKKYPNCFDIVYQSAVLYSEKGYEQKDRKASFRALELFDMACGLIGQNKDESISELSIRRQISRLHLSLGHADTCVDMLKKNNACGINNAMIGMVLADCQHRPEEAIVYLGKALARSLDDLDAIMMGYANVFFQRRDYKTTVACIEWLRSTLRPGYPPEAATWFDKYDCVLLVLCAETYCAMGDLESARDYLTKAAKRAAWFDGVDSSKICESKLFAEMGITNQTHYDNFGRTAMEAAERRVMTDAEFVPGLPAIWAEIRKDI